MYISTPILMRLPAFAYGNETHTSSPPLFSSLQAIDRGRRLLRYGARWPLDQCHPLLSNPAEQPANSLRDTAAAVRIIDRVVTHNLSVDGTTKGQCIPPGWSRQVYEQCPKISGLGGRSFPACIEGLKLTHHHTLFRPAKGPCVNIHFTPNLSLFLVLIS
jgi:hypothetical protein